MKSGPFDFRLLQKKNKIHCCISYFPSKQTSPEEEKEQTKEIKTYEKPGENFGITDQPWDDNDLFVAAIQTMVENTNLLAKPKPDKKPDFQPDRHPRTTHIEYTVENEKQTSVNTENLTCAIGNNADLNRWNKNCVNMDRDSKQNCKPISERNTGKKNIDRKFMVPRRILEVKGLHNPETEQQLRQQAGSQNRSKAGDSPMHRNHNSVLRVGMSKRRKCSSAIS